MSGVVGPRIESIFNSYSFNFDGTDDGITCVTDSTINPVSAITVSLWVNGTIGGAGASTSRLFDRRFFYVEHISTNRIRCRIFQSAGSFQTLQTGVVNIYDDNWHHIFVSYDIPGNSAKIYLDNNLLVNTTVTMSTFLNSSQPIGIGTNYLGNGLFFNGKIDEPAYWHNTDQSSNYSTIWNNGTPNDLSDLQPSFWLRMGDKATWNGSQWTLSQQGFSVEDGVSSGMDENNRVLDTP